ncbi:MAG TPA: hypothetical protein VJX10_19945 [Pseudonocardiaceae bacterium]|nr:hypothetical protein [Pseudonocardiaceae bacterium]
MLIENFFEVAADPDGVFGFLQDANNTENVTPRISITTPITPATNPRRSTRVSTASTSHVR